MIAEVYLHSSEIHSVMREQESTHAWVGRMIVYSWIVRKHPWSHHIDQLSIKELSERLKFCVTILTIMSQVSVYTN